MDKGTMKDTTSVTLAHMFFGGICAAQGHDFQMTQQIKHGGGKTGKAGRLRSEGNDTSLQLPAARVIWQGRWASSTC